MTAEMTTPPNPRLRDGLLVEPGPRPFVRGRVSRTGFRPLHDGQELLEVDGLDQVMVEARLLRAIAA